MTRSPPGSFRSTPGVTALTTTGMSSFRASGPGQLYAWRAHGPLAPERGLRFDAEKILIDPYGLAVAVPEGYDRDAAARPGDNAATAMKSVVADPGSYDWEGDQPLRRPFAETVIYETARRRLHPPSQLGRGGGQARHLRRPDREDPLSQGSRDHRGRIAAGLPVRPAGRPARPDQLLGLSAGLVLRAASGLQLAARRRLAALDEFRDMVKALHRAGIEVILDVVFNHTAEGGADGPTLCYRGLDNDSLLHPRSRIRPATPTTAAAATRSTPITPSFGA